MAFAEAAEALHDADVAEEEGEVLTAPTPTPYPKHNPNLKPDPKPKPNPISPTSTLIRC